MVMNEGHKILINSLSIFLVLVFGFLAFGFFVHPNVFFNNSRSEVLPATEVLSVVDSNNAYGFECPSNFKTIHVPKDFSNIQSAINSTNVGTKIMIASGVYNENIKMKENICLVGEEFGKVEVFGFSGTVIEATNNNQIKNLIISNLGMDGIGISVINAQFVDIQMNAFNNLTTGVFVSENSSLNLRANVLTSVQEGVKMNSSRFFLEANRSEAKGINFEIIDSEGEFLGQVISGGTYGVKAKNSTIFFDQNIFTGHTFASMQLCKQGDYEIGDNFFESTNAEILY
jgi:hypothetical protein